jgi:2-oxoglutarate dehydrogenase E1 component
MQTQATVPMAFLDEVTRANPEYVESLYRDYRRDHGSVDERWALVFAGYELAIEGRRATAAVDDALPEGASSWRPEGASSGSPAVSDLVHCYREFGHLTADLDPLGRSPRAHPLLSPDELGFTEQALDRVVDWLPFRGGERGSLRDLLAALTDTYCRTLGVEYMGIPDKERRAWLQARMEPRRNHPDLEPADRHAIFEQLVAAEMFEQFLQARYPGQKRFSLEGGEALIPLLDTLVEEAARRGVAELVMGMPHRGRLNVLAHILEKPYEVIFAEFEGASLPDDVEGDGDVKYHLGHSHDHRTRRGRLVHLALAANPSHLEAVDPVIEGIARAKQSSLGDEARRLVLPVLMHGDAAFVGQGVVYETLALSALPAFTTGGTVHIIVNNQIAFTTPPADYVFTRYPSDPAHVVHAPVFHVNADDPEAAVQAARLAVDHRQRFGGDVFIDLVCYRRHGHNELDDPTLTQPVMYEKIRQHPSVVELYGRRLAAGGSLDEAEQARVRAARREALERARATTRREKPNELVLAFGGVWSGLGPAGDDWSADTRVAPERLRSIAEAMRSVPSDFTPHPRAKTLMDERWQRVDRGAGIDFATAELLAYGSLLLEGTPVRLSGQDSVRGTFSQRHAALFDTRNNHAWIALNRIADGQAEFEVVASPLSENAVLGFEYGMSIADPRRLSVWEAQFGDFMNGAQVVIDEFIAAGESKWQRSSGLVLLLPHGYEGQGPDHSSARLERFLQLTAERNLQVVNPSTPAQLFHGLRRQIHRRFRKPLVVMSPKSLLRHPRAVSTLADLADGTFQPLVDDATVKDPSRVHRVLVCSGKVFHALDAARERVPRDAALVRVEQLSPFPAFELTSAIRRYPRTAEVFWVQEEPANQGAWTFVRPLITESLGGSRRLRYVGRDEAASPATGLHHVHEEEERAILERALDSAEAAPAPEPPRARQAAG